MHVTEAAIRAAYATAATYLPDTAQPAAPRHLFRALDSAIERRYEDERLSPRETRKVREACAERLGWSTRWTQRTLAGELRDLSLEGLDLAELLGLRYANVAGRIWCHGAYSASHVLTWLPSPIATGLSHSGRPWVNLWTADSWHRNPTVLRARGGGGGGGGAPGGRWGRKTPRPRPPALTWCCGRGGAGAT
ncbi:hypothetical protein ACFVH9_08395, partial [Streptomyces hirsutus]|uniref:hypothetical protein n=1 Tax=Streptomyces hirsutus TaxID=35620 RepID=UPI00362AD319